MGLEERIKALEERADEQEQKRRALRNQLFALQMVLAKLLPIISASSTERLDAAIQTAKAAATNALLLAGFDEAEIADVHEEIACLRDDFLLDSEQAGQRRPWH